MLLTANIFQPLIDVFEAVLKFFHNSLGVSWGWSIVLLTVVIRLVLVPLTVKQFRSMQELQKHQPELKALQAKYKDDKARQQEELMKFYKENNVNPLGSCLPMVAQLPVFISLFYMLRQSLRADVCPAVQPHHLVKGVQVINHAVTTVACGPHNGAEFLFISDLTTNAKGITLAVLILLYVGTQFASTLLMSLSTPTMDRTQRQIMLVMPLLFVLFVLDFPAGVIVYWITTNTWTMIQQYVLRRRLGATPALAGAGGALAGPATGSGPDRGNGSGGSSSGGSSGGGLGGLLRGRTKDAEDEEAGVATKSRPAARQAVPPPSPRKKKKRSGRRR